jgi:hypothetical protein
VAVVSGMAVTVVHIVQVVTVRHRHMPATLTVGVSMSGMLVVVTGLALVRVTFMLTMQMAIVRVVDVIIVRDRHVTTAFAVRMVVSGMRLVLQGCCHSAHLQQSRATARSKTAAPITQLLSVLADKAAMKDMHRQTGYFAP